MEKDKELFTDPEEKKMAVTYFAVQIMMLMITHRVPSCNETLMALRLVVRLIEIVPDNYIDLLKNEQKFIEMANQELEFIMKDN